MSNELKKIICTAKSDGLIIQCKHHLKWSNDSFFFHQAPHSVALWLTQLQAPSKYNNHSHSVYGKWNRKMYSFIYNALLMMKLVNCVSTFIKVFSCMPFPSSSLMKFHRKFLFDKEMWRFVAKQHHFSVIVMIIEHKNYFNDFRNKKAISYHIKSWSEERLLCAGLWMCLRLPDRNGRHCLLSKWVIKWNLIIRLYNSKWLWKPIDSIIQCIYLFIPVIKRKKNLIAIYEWMNYLPTVNKCSTDNFFFFSCRVTQTHKIIYFQSNDHFIFYYKHFNKHNGIGMPTNSIIFRSLQNEWH